MLEDLEIHLKRLRRGPLCREDAPVLTWGRADLERVLPHRAPFLLVDAVEAFDGGARSLRGTRILEPGDPIFGGHFPGLPLYPGVMQIEMMAQAGLVLAHLLRPAEGPRRGLVTRVHHARFDAPLVPGQTARIHAALLLDDDITGVIAGQIFADDGLCSTCIVEAYYDA